MATLYAYSCNDCNFVGNAYEAENEAWGDGVAHLNNTGHESGTVQEFTGS